MSKEKEKEIDLGEISPPSAAASAPTPEQQAQRQVPVDVSKAHAAYANFCRVTGTPEELIIDFGLNTQPMIVPTDAIEISERIIMNYYTAKRMMAALQMSLQRHEAAFGVLETDVQKRVMPGLMRSPVQRVNNEVLTPARLHRRCRLQASHGHSTIESTAAPNGAAVFFALPAIRANRPSYCRVISRGAFAKKNFTQRLCAIEMSHPFV